MKEPCFLRLSRDFSAHVFLYPCLKKCFKIIVVFIFFTIYSYGHFFFTNKVNYFVYCYRLAVLGSNGCRFQYGRIVSVFFWQILSSYSYGTNIVLEQNHAESLRFVCYILLNCIDYSTTTTTYMFTIFVFLTRLDYCRLSSLNDYVQSVSTGCRWFLFIYFPAVNVGFFTLPCHVCGSIVLLMCCSCTLSINKKK